MATLDVRGSDGGTLLGFLAAVGSLRLLSEAHEDSTLAFDPGDDHAILGSGGASSAQAIEDAVVLRAQSEMRRQELTLLGAWDKPGDVSNEAWDELVRDLSDVRRDRLSFIAGLMCGAPGSDTVGEATLCAANGAGHQNMFQTLRDLQKLAGEEHLRRALTQPWTFDEGVPPEATWMGTRKPTLRWDEGAERLYALRLHKPTADPEPFTTQIGAYALAAAALPCFPVVPTLRGPRTTFTISAGRGAVDFFWPLWTPPVTMHTLRALHASGEAERDPDGARRRGVYRLLRARRWTQDKGKLTFGPATPIW